MYSKYNILLYNAGGPATVGIIKSLKNIKFSGKIITCDIDPLSAGSLMSDKNYIVPKTVDEENFWKSIKDIILNESINLIVPSGHGSDFFAKRKEELNKMNVFLYMSDFNSIEICENKYDFHNFLLNNNLHEYLPKLYYKGFLKDLLKLYQNNPSFIKFPLFIKPNHGGGSRDTLYLHNIFDLHRIDKNKEYLFFEYIDGNEYSIDVLVNKNKDIVCISPRERIQTKAGISTKGKIIFDDNINILTTKLCNILNLKGPLCIQVKKNNQNELKIIEINPRFGGGTYFTTLAGCNFMKLILDDLENVNVDFIKPKQITIVRYFEEIIIEN